jgi:hypothetical protein
VPGAKHVSWNPSDADRPSKVPNATVLSRDLFPDPEKRLIKRFHWNMQSANAFRLNNHLLPIADTS